MGLLHAKTDKGPRLAPWEQVKAALASLPPLPEITIPDLSALTAGLDGFDELPTEVKQQIATAITAAETPLKDAISKPLNEVNAQIISLLGMRDQALGKIQTLEDMIQQLEQAQGSVSTIPQDVQALALPGIGTILSLASHINSGAGGEIAALQRGIEQTQAMMQAITQAITQAEQVRDQLQNGFVELDSIINQLREVNP